MGLSYIQVSDKSYKLTNSCNTPYLALGNNKLPLSTGSGSNTMNLVVGGGGNYRALEYKSTSNTYYTSAVNSEGLSSTTALTRSSTSGESYETRSSTSGTNYGTKVGESYSKYTISNHDYHTYRNGSPMDNYSGVLVSATNANGYKVANSYNVQVLTHGAGYNSYEQFSYVTGTISTIQGTYGRTSTSGTFYGGPFGLAEAEVVTASYSKILSEYWTWQGGANWATSTWVKSIYQQILTTGTTYLTRSSTSNTIYLTRSSTSGYSGVSSSSTEEWQ